MIAGASSRPACMTAVIVVAGGSLAKLGMKFLGALDHDGRSSTIPSRRWRWSSALPTTTRPRRRCGGRDRHAPDVVGVPEAVPGGHRPARRSTRWDRHHRLRDLRHRAPRSEVTELAGDVASHRNFTMSPGLGAVRASRPRGHGSVRGRLRPSSFSPTQGHIASASSPRTIAGVRRAGELNRTMLLAKGSLFLGRMTRLRDGASIAPGGSAMNDVTTETYESSHEGHVPRHLGPDCAPCASR